MGMDRFKQVLETTTALYASGMDWLDLTEEVKAQVAGMDWPEDSLAWDDCLSEVIEAGRGSDGVLLSLLPFAGLDKGLPWPAVFSAMGNGLTTAEDHYALLHRLLAGYREGFLTADFMDVCLANLSRTGIHPASLILAGYPTLALEPFEELLTRAGGLPGLKTFRRAWDSCHLGTEPWAVLFRPTESMDGLHTIHPTIMAGVGWTPGLNPPRPSLGNSMVFGNGLAIGGGRGIKSIGCDVTVFGNLYLMGLAELESLGERIRVKGNLTIEGSPALEGLPSDLQVGGAITISEPRVNFEWGNLIEKGVDPSLRAYFDHVEFTRPSSLLKLQSA